jgi:hypothetical protein
MSTVNDSKFNSVEVTSRDLPSKMTKDDGNQFGFRRNTVSNV